MARYALAVGSKETPPFIRMAAVRPAVVVSPLAAQHFLNFFPLPHGQGSFRPTVIFHCFGRTFQITDATPLRPRLKLELHRGIRCIWLVSVSPGIDCKLASRGLDDINACHPSPERHTIDPSRRWL